MLFSVLQEALHANSLRVKPTQQALQAQKQTLDHLQAIHDHAQQLLHQNEQATQREQLPHGDLVVDVAGMGRLKTLGDARVAALRESIFRAGLEQILIWTRLKELGWDSMDVHQSTLTGIRSNEEVLLLYPLTPLTTKSTKHPKLTICAIRESRVMMYLHYSPATVACIHCSE